ncbi:MAG: response regulator transcription factor [Bacteroidales bacterium]|nr:response regulator transcription factor [Bacteroidales bacterium]
MNHEKAVNVIIVDDNMDFAKGLCELLSVWPYYKIIDVLNDGAEIVNHPMLWLTDLVLMDVNMPRLNGIKAGKQVNYHFPNIKMIAITLNKEIVYLKELVAAGFKGFIDKTTIVEDLEDVLMTVHSNKYAFPRNLLLSKSGNGNSKSKLPGD